jgi:hypothetical protein
MAIINLETLQPTQISRDLKGKYMLIYGIPKAGKTTFLSKFPKHLICAFEPGTNALQGAMAQPMSSWSDFKSVVGQLRKPSIQEKFNTIGIDTADKAWEMLEKHICAQEGVNQIGEIPYGRGYDLCKKEFSNTFDQIARLGYGLVFISHSAEKKFKDEKGDEYIQLAPALPQRPFDIINKLVDFIGYIRVKKDSTTGVTTHKIYFRGDDNFLAGSRFKYIEPVVDFSYQAVESAILNAIDKQVVESGGEATNDSNVFFQEEDLDYHTLMNEARELWGKIVGDNRDKALQMKEVIKETFGKDIQISKVTPEQVVLLNELVSKMKAMV